jgi:arylsulfatase A-like enzyme
MAVAPAKAFADQQPPNILWIFVEDMSPWLGCYGDKLNKDATPNMDALAARGVRFTRCYVPAPVCSSCRSGMIIGAMQTTTGTHNHRSSRDAASAINLPKGVETLPEIFRANGYFTFNLGKEDYNFSYKREDLYSKVNGPAPWRTRKKGQPFFGQIQLKGGKAKTNGVTNKITADDVTLPPYLPDNELFRGWWAHHYNCIRITDQHLGRIVESLKKDGVYENTILVFFTDHGQNHSVRHKQFCYEGGVHVPLIIAGPNKSLKAGDVRTDLVSGLDISASTLRFAGLELPKYVEGQDMFADELKRHRDILDKWVEETDDKGQYPESDAGLRSVLRQWKAKCVNPEYDRVRKK